MITVSTEEIISQKVLPYDIYDEHGTKLFNAGEILTPGKILLIRNHEILYKKEIILKKQEELRLDTEEFKSKEQKNKDLDIDTKKLEKAGPINKSSKINSIEQIELKSTYIDAIDVLNKDDVSKAKGMILTVRDKIIKDAQAVQKSVNYCSQLKLLGEHENCHALNTAIYSVFLANKLEYPESAILEIALSALLHDIGKIKLPKEINGHTKMTREEESKYRQHTLIGHKIIKNKLKLSDEIANVALEHHETMDGNGWPYGISSTMISDYTQIVAVCNCFDNLSSNRTHLEISNFREALKALLMKGSKCFSPKPLYVFVHMFNYGDSVSFEELKL